MRAGSTRHCERGRRGLLGQRPPERTLVMVADAHPPAQTKSATAAITQVLQCVP